MSVRSKVAIAMEKKMCRDVMQPQYNGFNEGKTAFVQSCLGR